MTQARAYIDEIRTLAFGDISGAYAEVGDPLGFPARLVCFTNNTDGDVLFTDDEDVDKIIVIAGGFKLFDIQSNINPNQDDKYVLPIGTQFYVKEVTNPTEGSVYIEVLY